MSEKTWKDQLEQLVERFPDAIKKYQPANEKQIKKTEQSIKNTLMNISPAWYEFLEWTNGASILDYCILGSGNSRIADIAEVNRELWDLGIKTWNEKGFISFMGDSTSMNIGFMSIAEDIHCVTFLSEPTDDCVLPIASSFNNFLRIFLEDVESALDHWVPSSWEKWPLGISDDWPFNLESWSSRDPELLSILCHESINNLLKGNDFYIKLVESVTRS
jgi:hypothetical protein